MATVRFSVQLQDEIHDTAKAIFQPSIAKAKADVPAHWADKMYQCFFPADIIAKFKALPDYAMKKEVSFLLTGFVNAPEDEFKTDDYTTNVYECPHVELKFSTAQPWPVLFNDAITGFKHGGFGDWNKGKANFKDARWDWFKPEFKEYKRKIFEQEAKQAKFLAGIKSITNRYSTLGPALKAWPALWDLLPDEAKERHKKIVEKKKAEVSSIGADLDGMTAAVTFNKLTK